MKDIKIVTGCVAVLTVIAVGFVLQATQGVFIPLFIAWILSYMMAPGVRFMSRLKVPSMLTIVPISLSVGANRLIPTVAIPHPLGNPNLSAEEEYKLRYGLVTRALKALQTPVTEQTVFAAD